MTKKALNQNAKYAQEFINSVEPDFVFNNKPINRFKIVESNKDNLNRDKIEKLSILRSKINSIEMNSIVVNMMIEMMISKVISPWPHLFEKIFFSTRYSYQYNCQSSIDALVRRLSWIVLLKAF